MMINDWKLFHPSLFQLSEVLPIPTQPSAGGGNNNNAKRTSKSDAELALLDKLVNTLLERKATETSSSSSPSNSQRLRPLSRSLSRSLRLGSFKRNNNNSTLPTIAESGGSGRRSDHALNPSMRNVLNTIRNAPQRFSQATEEENKNLTKNILE